ncbi:MAG TPA: hypothetical protein VMG12_04765 [Polyangiaceae bacterium]|nr:hypothetical protein [Polyangiaceae bacterium]
MAWRRLRSGLALVLAVCACRAARAADGIANVAPDAGRPPVLIGDGLLLDDTPGAPCFPVCGFPRLTDPDKNGDLDGFGYEGQRACIADGTTLALSSSRCDVVPLPNLPAPGPGIWRESVCLPACSSALTDRDPATGVSDGWGYERRRNCIVAGTAAALGGVPCDPGSQALPPGDGIDVVIDAAGKRECRPLCRNPTYSDPDGDGFGYEHEQSCIVSASVPALQGLPCDAPDWPPPPPPPPPPPGEGWNADYTATMFGEIDCARFGFDDPGDSDLNLAACVSRGAAKLDANNQVYFGATGDLSSLWTGASCSCQGGERGRCRTPPACPEQGNCGTCVEVTCNFEGRHSFQDDGATHNEYCRPGRSVVVQLIDACPHNHPNNPYWCTEARKNHIDISCSAFREITDGRDIGKIGSVNVHARPVDCSVGLGPRSFR